MYEEFFPNNSDVIVTIDGSVFREWTSLEITRSMDSLVGTASLNIAVGDNNRENTFDIVDGASFQVSVISEDSFKTDPLAPFDGTAQFSQKAEAPMMTGWVVGVSDNITEGGWTMSVAAADKTIDLTQCSVDVPRYEWRNATLYKIAQDLCKPFDIFVTGTAAQHSQPFKEFVARPDETPAAILSRAAKARGVMLLSDQFGNLLLENAQWDQSPGVHFTYGVNLYSVSRTRSDNYKFSDYTCYGQVSGKGQKWGKGTTTLNAKAKDLNVKRYRPKVFQIESNVSKAVVQDRVNWEAQVRNGQSASFTVSVPGWFTKLERQASVYRPFQINSIATLAVDKWKSLDNYMISEVTFSDTNSGRKSSVVLVDRRTYKPSPGSVVDIKKKKKKK
jgi:prophage tail gpP-like protein